MSPKSGDFGDLVKFLYKDLLMVSYAFLMVLNFLNGCRIINRGTIIKGSVSVIRNKITLCLFLMKFLIR